MLHAHLPYVRHPEYPRFLEEMWLFEAISETYLPFLRMCNRLKADAVPFRLTVSVSPTLSAMLTDPLLQTRYIEHLLRMIDLSDTEVRRTSGDADFEPLARMYAQMYRDCLHDFNEVYKRDITKGFRDLQKSGHLDLITTAATHCFLPLYEHYPKAIDVQINTAILSHGRTFGANPSGLWLPECGYFPGLERHLKRNGIEYFFTAAHAILFSRPRVPYGVYSPVSCPNGIHAFGRDVPSSHAVWSSEEGYPGDVSYRDFYRDIGFDLPLDYVRRWIHDGDIRIATGIKYYAITGAGGRKRPYRTDVAAKKVGEHAENFIYHRLKQVGKLRTLMDRPPIVVCPYDAELFGHWWFEGPLWLEAVLRGLVEHRSRLRLVTPKEYLEMYPENPRAVPSFSSWGNNGYAEVWLDASNDWIYPHVHKAIERMAELVERYPDEDGLKLRALNQAARELMLSQASDWPFIMKTGTTVPYATKRVKEHLANFATIYEGLRRNAVNTEWLTRMERKNNLFSDLDYRLFGDSQRASTRAIRVG